ncbi:hypothetical protein M408DRAFT_27058 [Serendipita vermifera MAFF 305830]|uniref:Uncharacterized protein n=1 Tax=Serendipita vermifera MAFF 305830 TaxID=933852 RepID=A0A0C2X4X7_SERVB|nr:hypothetical protein M408DRAFT_27058 [Serendipita vermifera MAFF 305830]
MKPTGKSARRHGGKRSSAPLGEVVDWDPEERVTQQSRADPASPTSSHEPPPLSSTLTQPEAD